MGGKADERDSQNVEFGKERAHDMTDTSFARDAHAVDCQQ